MASSGSELNAPSRASASARSLTARSSLKWRLAVLLSALFIGMLMLAAVAYVIGAKQQIGTEWRAATQLAQALLRSAPDRQGVPLLSRQALLQLEHARHLRAAGPDGVADRSKAYPDWFGSVIPGDGVPDSIPILITEQGRVLGAGALVPTPDDERAEIWSNIKHAILFGIGLLALLNLGAWLILRWQLRPLESLRRALDRIGSGEREVRLAPSAVEEVAAVERGFNGMAAALHDADAQNRQLVRELLRVQEEERRAIARELHDEFAQQASAIDAEAAVLATVLRDRPAALASVAAIRAGARSLLRITRGRLEALRPEVLDEFGVVAAIEELCDGFQDTHHDIVLTRSLPRELPLNDEQSIAVFRVLQESLTNVARHARASQVEVELRQAGGARAGIVELTVSDDGVGLPAGRPSRAGFGLLGMRERVESLGGRFMLRTGAQGHGLAVVAALPLAGFG